MEKEVQLRVVKDSDRPLLCLFYAKCKMLLARGTTFGCVTSGKWKKSCHVEEIVGRKAARAYCDPRGGHRRKSKEF